MSMTGAAGNGESLPDLTRWAEGLRQQAARYGEFHTLLNEITITEISADGAVRVTVDARGVPTELTVTERSAGLRPEELTSRLNTTLRRAQAKLRKRVAELAEDVIGDDPPVNRIVADYQQRFPDARPERASRDHSRPRRLGEIEDDEDGDGNWDGDAGSGARLPSPRWGGRALPS